MEAKDAKISKTQEILAGVKDGLAKAKLDNQVSELLGGILAAMENVVETQTGFASVLVDCCKVKVSDKFVSPPAGGTAKPPPVKVTKPVPTADEIRKKKFVTAVREAEKAILLFNLDLGTVPIMNTSTISLKVTQDLAAKAATVEERPAGRPSEDTVAMLDDTISLIKGMEFYGKVTKKYTNTKKPEDPSNGKFCTLPVKISFKDRDTKFQAESLLRAKCKVSCTTPYHLNLRKAIRKVLDEEKGVFKEDFIQVRVDPEAGSLKLSRKCKGKWLNNYKLVELDDTVYDLGHHGNQVVVPESMETDGGDSTL